LSITSIAWRRVLQGDGVRAAKLLRQMKHLKRLDAQSLVDNAPPGLPVEVANANLLNAIDYETEEDD
jgi:hypothetical protein